MSDKNRRDTLAIISSIVGVGSVIIFGIMLHSFEHDARTDLLIGLATFSAVLSIVLFLVVLLMSRADREDLAKKIETAVKEGVENGVKEGVEKGIKEGTKGLKKEIKAGIKEGIKEGVKAAIGEMKDKDAKHAPKPSEKTTG